jgi:5-methyltetrahydropteroyltriglutamate--homocysteine methyltransferase
MSRIRASIVGSLPKPSWLAEPEKLRGAWRLPPELLAEGTDDAVKLWADEQERASLDVVTDGEQRRRHYIWGFIESLMKVDFDQLGLRKSRGQRYVQQTPAPRVLGEMQWSGPVLTEGLRFLKSRTKRPVKITLPGPMTVADSVIDEFGGRSDAEFAMAYAKLLNKEVRALSEAGADVIQIDEPCFNIYLDEVGEWGMEALELAFEGVTAKRAVHICYGYGVPQVLAWKSANKDWNQYHHTLPLLAKSSIDQVSVECTASGINLEVLGTAQGQGSDGRRHRRRHRAGRDAGHRRETDRSRPQVRPARTHDRLHRLRPRPPQPPRRRRQDERAGSGGGAGEWIEREELGVPASQGRASSSPRGLPQVG